MESFVSSTVVSVRRSEVEVEVKGPGTRELLCSAEKSLADRLKKSNNRQHSYGPLDHSGLKREDM